MRSVEKRNHEAMTDVKKPEWSARKHGFFHFSSRTGSVGVPVKAVIFDMDGTLIDTKEIYYDIIDIAFRKLNFPPVERAVLVNAASEADFNWDMILPPGVKVRKDEVLPEVRAIIGEISLALFRERAKLIAGADDVLKSLHGAGLVLGVVTSSQVKYLDMKLQAIEKTGVAALFDVIITPDDVRMKKPSPEPLYECARRLAVAPGECVYVGDMRVDIIAGKSAGMKTVGVLTGFDDYALLENEHPDVILESVASLKHYFTFP